VAGLLLAVAVLLAAAVSEGAFEPQPALLKLIRATIAKAASRRGVLLMVAPWDVEMGLTGLCRRAGTTAPPREQACWVDDELHAVGCGSRRD
jgi:hypothetical protein